MASAQQRAAVLRALQELAQPGPPRAVLARLAARALDTVQLHAAWLHDVPPAAAAQLGGALVAAARAGAAALHAATSSLDATTRPALTAVAALSRILDCLTMMLRSSGSWAAATPRGAALQPLSRALQDALPPLLADVLPCGLALLHQGAAAPPQQVLLLAHGSLQLYMFSAVWLRGPPHVGQAMLWQPELLPSLQPALDLACAMLAVARRLGPSAGSASSAGTAPQHDSVTAQLVLAGINGFLFNALGPALFSLYDAPESERQQLPAAARGALASPAALELSVLRVAVLLEHLHSAHGGRAVAFEAIEAAAEAGSTSAGVGGSARHSGASASGRGGSRRRARPSVPAVPPVTAELLQALTGLREAQPLPSWLELEHALDAALVALHNISQGGCGWEALRGGVPMRLALLAALAEAPVLVLHPEVHPLRFASKALYVVQQLAASVPGAAVATWLSQQAAAVLLEPLLLRAGRLLVLQLRRAQAEGTALPGSTEQDAIRCCYELLCEVVVTHSEDPHTYPKLKALVARSPAVVPVLEAAVRTTCSVTHLSQTHLHLVAHQIALAVYVVLPPLRPLEHTPTSSTSGGSRDGSSSGGGGGSSGGSGSGGGGSGSGSGSAGNDSAGGPRLSCLASCLKAFEACRTTVHPAMLLRAAAGVAALARPAVAGMQPGQGSLVSCSGDDAAAARRQLRQQQRQQRLEVAQLLLQARALRLSGLSLLRLQEHGSEALVAAEAAALQANLPHELAGVQLLATMSQTAELPAAENFFSHIFFTATVLHAQLQLQQLPVGDAGQALLAGAAALAEQLWALMFACRAAGPAARDADQSLDVKMAVLCSALATRPNLAQSLVDWASAVCAALPCADAGCNSPECRNFCRLSEADIVAKASTCSSCKTARYCSKACAVQHWPAHKPVCKRIRAAAAAAAAPAPALAPAPAAAGSSAAGASSGSGSRRC